MNGAPSDYAKAVEDDLGRTSTPCRRKSAKRGGRRQSEQTECARERCAACDDLPAVSSRQQGRQGYKFTRFQGQGSKGSRTNKVRSTGQRPATGSRQVKAASAERAGTRSRPGAGSGSGQQGQGQGQGRGQARTRWRAAWSGGQQAVITTGRQRRRPVQRGPRNGQGSIRRLRMTDEERRQALRQAQEWRADADALKRELTQAA